MFQSLTAKPNEEHWNAVKYIFQYLVGTLNYGILYSHNGETGCSGYSDTDWGGDSTSGYVFCIAGGPVSWQSCKQSCVALSTSEAEYIALTSAAQEAVWLQQLLAEVKRNNP